MVPNFSRRGKGIKGAALYVLHDKDKADTSERVGFTATRNLSTDDPNIAWRLMCATAANRDALKAAAGVHKGGREASNFCAHISLSWHPDEEPTDAEMLSAADSLLKAYEYDKLQALLVRHTDAEHQHLHIVVNLIDPETGRAAKNEYNDFKKILQPWAYEYERENGRIWCENRARHMEERATAEQAQQRDPDRDQAPPIEDVKPARKPWLSRREWEAQQVELRAAKKEAVAGMWERHKAERQALVDETKEEARHAAAEVREHFRPEWAVLHKERRDQERQLLKQQKALQRELDYAIKSPLDRVHFVGRHGDLLEPSLDADRISKLEALLHPTRLQAAVAEVHDAQRQTLAENHKEKTDELKGVVNGIRSASHAEIWQRHGERFEELAVRQAEERRAVWRDQVAPPTPETGDKQPANENPTEKAEPPRQTSYKIRPSTNKYEELKKATGEATERAQGGKAPDADTTASPATEQARAAQDAALEAEAFAEQIRKRREERIRDRGGRNRDERER